MVLCPSCGHDNPKDASFCTECGGKLATTCPRCTHSSPPGSVFCAGCGYRLAALSKPTAVPDSLTHTPGRLAEKVLRDRAALVGERRTVAVLFADAMGFVPISERLDEEDVYDLMQGCLSRMMEAVHRYEGTITQFAGDGIMARCAAPIAHEDSARRAVAAALGMQKSLYGYPAAVKKRHAIKCRFRVGLNTGPVVVGKISDKLDMDYTALGYTVNLAARLEELAEPGTVHLNGNTYGAVQDYFECEPLGPLTVKGKAEPVVAYKLVRQGLARTRFEAAAERGGTLGNTRLVKLAYLAGVEHYARASRALTGFRWIYRYYGPYSLDFKTALATLDSDIPSESLPTAGGYQAGVFRVTRPNDLRTRRRLSQRATSLAQRGLDRWALEGLYPLLSYACFRTRVHHRIMRGGKEMQKVGKRRVSKKERMANLQSFVLEHWQVFEASPEQYQWPWEIARWHELVFCLLLRLGQPELDADMARSLTNMLADLDMLRIETLAGLAPEGEEPDFTHPDLALMLRLLERSGLHPARARAAVTTICQAALGLQKRHGGKVQRYLRRYGQQMLDELGEHFSFSSMSEEDTRYAFTHWLQNVLNIPLALSEPAVEKLCKKLGVTVDDLVEVADGLDLNLALLDDMVASSIEEEA